MHLDKYHWYYVVNELRGIFRLPQSLHEIHVYYVVVPFDLLNN